MRAYEGLKIIDFTQMIAGPLATQMFSLLGAEVIKIESPVQGDQMRRTLTDPDMAARHLAPSFLSANIGKRSIAIDLKSKDGQEVVRKLIETADVVVENFRAGVAKNLNIDYDTVKALNPKVVFCSISGYGQTGPRSGEKAYDTAIQANSGMMALTGHPETGPTKAGFLAVDSFTGMSGAFAIASALARRQLTGEGQFLDVAMYDSALTMISTQMADYLVRDNVPDLMGNDSATEQPTAGAFETADGVILLATLTSEQQETVFRVLGLEDLLNDPRYATPESRRENLTTGRESIGAVLKTRTTAEWYQIIKKENVPVQPIRSLAEAAADPQLEHRGVLVKAEGIEGIDHPVTLIGAPFIADVDGPITQSTSPGKVGQHSRDVLEELGYTPDRIDEILSA